LVDDLAPEQLPAVLTLIEGLLDDENDEPSPRKIVRRCIVPRSGSNTTKESLTKRSLLSSG
jgi:hypothetical protein